MAFIVVRLPEGLQVGGFFPDVVAVSVPIDWCQDRILDGESPAAGAEFGDESFVVLSQSRLGRTGCGDRFSAPGRKNRLGGCVGGNDECADHF